MESSCYRHEPTRAWFLLVFATFFHYGIPLGRCEIHKENELSPLLLEDILPSSPKAYDKMTPPKQDGKATEVQFHVTVMSLDSIDESSMTFTADVFFAQTWKDHRLHFAENMSAEYRLLPLNWLHEIWRPDSYFKNAKRVTFQDMTVPNHYVWLYQDKTILYMTKLTLLLSCAMNFQRYPHDTQQCAMKIESLSHTTADLVFTWEPKLPLAVERIELPQLDLVSTTTGDCTQVYSTGNFTCLELVFTLQRRLGYYLFHTYIPTCLIVIMSWISFWLRPEAVPARVTLGVTSLLTLSTQHANSQKSLPPVSYIKAIDLFMSSCTIFVFCSLMEYALVNVMLGDLVDGCVLSHVQQSSVITRSWRHVSQRLSRPRTRATSRTRPRSSVATISTEMETQLNGGGGDNEVGLTTVVTNRNLCLENKPEGVSVSPGPQSLPNHPLAPAPVGPSARHPELVKRRAKALMIDRVSRVLFPGSFFILNVIYWCAFVLTEPSVPIGTGTSP